MALPYVPTNWLSGDIVSSARLNKLEGGVKENSDAIVENTSDINNLKSEIDDLGDTYAKQDGSYDTMTVGQAKQLVATVGVEDKVPYLFRTTGGSADVGDRKTMGIVGGTIAWNQLAAPLSSFVGQNATIAVSDGVATLTASGSVAYVGLADSGTGIISPIGGHKYLMTAKINGPNNSQISFAFGNSIVLYGYAAGDVWKEISGILTQVSATGRYVQLRVFASFAAEDVVSVKDLMVIDLTQMFGSTIADYIYALETANEGAGVAFFRKLFTAPYYAYNVGELMSVKTSANVTTGFNQFDKTASYLSSPYRYVDTLIGENHELYMTLKDKDTSVSVSDIYIGFTDTNESNAATRSYNWVLQSGVVQESHSNKATTGTYNKLCKYVFIFPASDDAWSRINRRYDICVNIKWDGERDGEYEPYVSHEYALDSDLELRGIPKLDADNSLYYDGDTYQSDGTVKRKYGIVDLGTLNWTYDANARFFTSGIASTIKLPTSGQQATYASGIFSAKYTPDSNLIFSSPVDMTMCKYTNGDVYFKNSAYTDKDAFKAAMSGVYLIYELATPVTESADPYQTPQIVNDFGTEEFVDTRDVPIPVGHDTMYQANLRAKLEMAPDSPSGNGDYIVRHSNGQNAYVPITFPADELPAAPTEDGSYVLNVTVASGAATYTWEAQP